MKRLYIMRHAKSSWDDATHSDFDRPLNARGIGDAPVMGKMLKAQDISLQLLLSSPANRAKTTAGILATALNYPAEDILYHDSIYEASVMNLLMIIRTLPKELESVLLVGHNPALTALINNLGDSPIDNLPTAGVVGIQLETDWESVGSKVGKVVFYEYPKKHRG